jgi:hypothetical protein
MAALKETKLRFAMRLQIIDDQHPLIKRIPTLKIPRGRGAGGFQVPKTKVQRLGKLLPSIPQPILRPPHYSDGCRTDPINGIDKKAAAEEFNKW